MKASHDEFLPELTAKDIRNVDKCFEQEIKRLEKEDPDFQNMDSETKKAIITSLHSAFNLSKRVAKKRFTPKKYRYWEKE